MAHSGLALAFLCIVSVCGWFVGPTPLKSEDWTAYLRHHDRIRQFPCSVPKPTVVQVERIDPNCTQDPWETVLHRCDGSGCCPPGKTCQSSAVQRVELTFLLKDIITNKTRIKKIFMSNHTECQCAEFRTYRRSRLR